MASPEGAGAAGTVQDPGGTPPAEGADQGAAGAAGAGAEGAGAQGGGAVEFDRGMLHPALRDLTPTQMTELFETMAAGLRQQATGGPPPGGQVPPPPPAPQAPKPLAADEVKELLDPNSEKFNPTLAFRNFVETNYGGLIGDINVRSIRGLYGTFKAQLPDFGDYEEDITKALSTRDPRMVTEQDVLNVYLAAKGLRATLREKADAARKKGATTLAPSTPVAPTKDVELSDVEKEVAHKMFAGRIGKDGKALDPEAEYKRFAAMESDGGFTVKVPVGGGKFE